MEKSNVPPAHFAEYHKQAQCPLFTALPPEIRSEIFAYSLAGGPDPTRPAEQSNYCNRPGFETRHRIWTQLLRTCKRVYVEAWFMPFTGCEHVFYLTDDNRRPERITSVKELQQALDWVHARHGKIDGGSIRIFAQLSRLEDPSDFLGIFDLHHFHPTNVTLTIRYTDTWFWEADSPLRIGGRWGESLKLPVSVSSFRIDLESLERRKDEVTYIAREAATKWHFTRRDGTLLLSDPSNIAVSRWTGSSMLGGERWVRDEVRPGQLDYYVATVAWRASPDSLGSRPQKNPNLYVDWNRPAPRRLEYDSIPEEDLMYARIPLDSTPEEAATAYYGFKHKSLMIIPS